MGGRGSVVSHTSQKVANSPPLFGKLWKLHSRKKYKLQEIVTKLTTTQKWKLNKFMWMTQDTLYHSSLYIIICTLNDSSIGFLLIGNAAFLVTIAQWRAI